MSEQPSPHLRLAKGAALVCSVSLGLLVIVNAQFGCDAPTATTPEDSAPAKTDPTAKAEPTAKAGEPAPQPVIAEPEVDPPANVEAAPEAPNEPNEPERPIMMPASKSGGDFGAMRFPGQAPAQQQQKQQAPNAAPNPSK